MRRLLIYRFILANTLLVALAAGLAWEGYLAPIFTEDTTRLTYGIAGLFVIAWGWSLKETIVASQQLDASGECIKPAHPALRDKDFAKVEWLGAAANWLVGLGLLGTVIGFSIALGGIDQGAVADATGAQGAVASLMNGMKVALNTTLLGVGLALWHELNCRVLRTALAIYWADRIAAGGRR